MILFPTVDEDYQYFVSQGYSGSINDMHYQALGALGYTGSYTDRLYAYLIATYGSYNQALYDLRSGVSTFALGDAYTVANLNPDLVFDFASDFYRTGGSTSTFDASLTYTGASAKTMVDSDGLVKWAPHNHVKYSEDFDNAAWVKEGVTVASGIADPDGGSTAWSLTQDETTGYHRAYLPISPSRSPEQIYTAYLKSNGSQFVQLFYGYGAAARHYCTFDLINGVTGTPGGNGLPTASIADVGSGWYKCSLGDLSTDGSTTVWVILGEAIDDLSLANSQPQFTGDGSSGAFIWHPHAYRSDLGGMVDNPDRSDSYVPTTSAAVYLPRRGHHIYNGSSWVNEGIQIESEARTNLATYSSDLQAATDWDIFGTNSLTITSSVDANAIGSDGETSLYRVEITDTTNEAHGADLDVPFSGATNYTLSIAARAGEQRYLSLRLYSAGTSWATVTFDMLNGTVTQEDVGSTGGTVQASGVINLGGGLYRCWFSGQTPTGNASLYGFAYSFASVGTPTNSGGVESYAGTGGDGCWLGEAQFELGSTPSSYIPTAGATVTRAAETLTVAAADLPYSATNMSIQMDGELTYADEGAAQQQIILRWQADGDNKINWLLDTDAADTGEVLLQQKSLTVQELVYHPTQYTPGINVDWNLATRNGATVCNVAKDGTAATADLTPTTLPDLSATDLTLAYDYMGTIGKFRMWDENLGDTGITSASARTYTTEFAMIVATTAAGETFTIPCQNSGTFNAGIDWGDGQVSSITAYNDARLSHTYAAAGDHVIRITGTFPNIWFNNGGDKLKVKSVENFGEVGWTRADEAFYGCSNMTSFTAGTTDTSALLYMDNMFRDCSSLTTLDVTNFDTSSVTNMSVMFYSCSSLTSLDVTNFNTASVTSMSVMFRDCSSLTSLDVSGFDTSSVTNMNTMFRGCSSLTSLDVTNLNTASVTSMGSLFYNCSSLTSLDVTNFNTALVTNMVYMFQDCSSLTSLDVTNFNTAAVTSMGNMFHDCTGLTSLDVTNFNTAAVTAMTSMFRDCISLTSLDVTNFNTALVTTMNAMFYNCSSLTSLDVTNFNTALVTTMGSMFYKCSGLPDIVGVDTFDIGGLDSTSDLNNFAYNVTLPTARYDALLLAWEAQDPFDGMSPNYGSSTYTGGGAVATAHASLISRDGWTITDGGVA